MYAYCVTRVPASEKGSLLIGLSVCACGKLLACGAMSGCLRIPASPRRHPFRVPLPVPLYDSVAAPSRLLIPFLVFCLYAYLVCHMRHHDPSTLPGWQAGRARQRVWRVCSAPKRRRSLAPSSPFLGLPRRPPSGPPSRHRKRPRSGPVSAPASVWPVHQAHGAVMEARARGQLARRPE